MPREIIEVVESVLGESEEILGFLLLKRVRLDRDAEWENGTACLELESTAWFGRMPLKAMQKQPSRTYLSIRPSEHLL